MSVVRTDKWLLDGTGQPLEICKRLIDYFPNASADLIFDYLTSHGMYRSPLKNGREKIRTLQQNNVWDFINKEAQQLQKDWKGPDVPIFILPSDPANRRMRAESNGTSGLAFKDKLFLFVSEGSQKKNLQALLTHEYHHICRLARYKKEEEDYTLLDSIIMEGLAEHAVRERLGEEAAAAWTRYYSRAQVENIWNSVIFPYKDLRKKHPKHHRILYGLKGYPKMAGYCVGYHLVCNYTEGQGLKTDELMELSAETIAKIPEGGSHLH